MTTAQKLLLFWRKPAVSRPLALRPVLIHLQRKCWWDGVEVDVPKSSTSKEMIKVKVWARRVWTLELSLVSHRLGELGADGFRFDHLSSRVSIKPAVECEALAHLISPVPYVCVMMHRLSRCLTE